MPETPETDAPARRSFDDRDRAILELERGHWKYPGAKDAEIIERFGLSATRYYQRLDWILAQPEALAYDATTVRRLLRLREQRIAARRNGTSGHLTSSDVRGVRPAFRL